MLRTAPPEPVVTSVSRRRARSTVSFAGTWRTSSERTERAPKSLVTVRRAPSDAPSPVPPQPARSIAVSAKAAASLTGVRAAGTTRT